MVRVQIQLPDKLLARARSVAAAKEMSFAEIARRGLELFLAQSPTAEDLDRRWQAPKVAGLGWKGLSHDEIREAAQATSIEEELEEHARTPTRF